MLRAFGLDLESAVDLPGLDEAKGPPGARSARLELAAPEDLKWSQEEAETRLRHKFADGSPMIEIAEHPRLGWRVWGANTGATVVSHDGTLMVCAPPDPDDAALAPFLIGQVLPLAALLQGLEVLHASAVAMGGSAVAFSGPSGSGKTSLALRMVGSGALYMADDVIALELAGDGVLVHPGAALASVLAAGGRHKVAQAVPREHSPRPLGALVFVHGPSDAAPSVDEARDARRILGSTFNALVTTPERQKHLLDVASAIAASATVLDAVGDLNGVAAGVREQLSARGIAGAPKP
jgi:hypothetical protein